jgi:4-coumarate--CoA ligase
MFLSTKACHFSSSSGLLIFFSYVGIASGLRLTLANSAYTAYELGFQYTNSGATLVFTIPDLLPVVLEMFEKTMKMSKDEARKRIVVVGDGLEWANAGSKGVGAIDAKSLAGAGVTTATAQAGTRGADASLNAAWTGKEGGFVRVEDLLNYGKLEKEEEFDGQKKADETLFLCYSSVGRLFGS